MFDYDHGNLLSAFDTYFSKTEDLHPYNTRSASQGKLFSLKNSHTNHGNLQIQNIGVAVYNKMINLGFYKGCKTKHTFGQKYKTYLISLY